MVKKIVLGKNEKKILKTLHTGVIIEFGRKHHILEERDIRNATKSETSLHGPLKRLGEKGLVEKSIGRWGYGMWEINKYQLTDKGTKEARKVKIPLGTIHTRIGMFGSKQSATAKQIHRERKYRKKV
jgi:DNA-binding PadR family transcriptional regulator